MTSPTFDDYTKDHWSCLLYLETRIVDHGGTIERMRMNDADWVAVDHFVDRDGLVVWGGTGLNPVFSLTDRGWAVAHALRRLRAESGGSSTDDKTKAAIASIRPDWTPAEREDYILRG